MECLHDYKHNLILNLHKAVKLCQTEFVNKTEVVTEFNNSVSQLCKEWEIIFFHGLKKRINKNIFSLKINNLSEIPNNLIQQIKPLSHQNNVTFWPFICEFLESDEIARFTDTLDKIDTEIGRCRAWLRSSINERTLEPFCEKVVSNGGQSICRKYYDNYAVLLDAEESTVLPNLAAGISSIMFALDINNDTFNNYPESSGRSQNNSTSSSVSRPVLFSSSTSGSFEDIEIIESVIKPNNNGDLNAKNNARKKNRIINIIPIDDDDDGVSDSSDLYSPFNLLKTSVLNTGLNFVSKFQFGNDEKLSNIQEQENTTLKIDPNNPALLNGGFREFDEREFEDCCLSLQKEFYSPLSNELPTNHIIEPNQSTNKTFLSADLVAVEPVVGNLLFSDISSVFPGTVSSTCPDSIVADSTDQHLVNDNHIQENEEIEYLKSQLVLKSQENDLLRNQIDNAKLEFEEKEKQFEIKFSKLLRENELLKKRLKSIIVQDKPMERKQSISDDFCDNSEKIEQLLHMHGDILELNDQLQRSLVDKDIKIGMLQSKISKLMEYEESSGVHFDNFGTIYLGIIDYFQRGSGTSKHFCYKIHIRCCPLSSDSSDIKNDEWITCRRYKEFHKFYQEFITKFPSEKNIMFPSKWLYKPTIEQLFERQKGLESFLCNAVNYIFQNTFHRNNSDMHSKPVTYESFKRVGRWGWSSADSGSINSTSNYLDGSNTNEFSDSEKNILSRQKVISVISFLAPNSDESL